MSNISKGKKQNTATKSNVKKTLSLKLAADEEDVLEHNGSIKVAEKKPKTEKTKTGATKELASKTTAKEKSKQAPTKSKAVPKEETFNIAQDIVDYVPPKQKNFVKIFTIAFITLDIAFMVFFFITLTLLLTHTIMWSKVYTIITFSVIVANFPFLIYMLVSMLKTTKNSNNNYN